MNKKIKEKVVKSVSIIKECNLPEEVLNKIKEAFIDIAHNKARVSESYYGIEDILWSCLNVRDISNFEYAFYDLGFLIHNTVTNSPMLVGECYEEDSRLQKVYWDQYVENIREETCIILGNGLDIAYEALK